MKHEYLVSGITCEGCVSKVKTALEKVPGVITAVVGLNGQVGITMSRHITTTELQEALRHYPKYQLKEMEAVQAPVVQILEQEPVHSFWQAYKPILLVFGYIFGITLLVETAAGDLEWMRWMRHFMAGFFLVFSFFKLLDIPAFAASYSSYDVVARRWPGWGYAYPFIELGLGVLFLINIYPLVTNGLTFIIMGVSSIGVLQSLLAKRRIQCACLGAVFNLPMSKVTLFEDILMVGMSGIMLIIHL